jgi:hypothetical protein
MRASEVRIKTMKLLDYLKLLTGMPLTTRPEREFSAACVSSTQESQRHQKIAQEQHLETQQSEHDAGRLDLKGLGQAFALPPTTAMKVQLQNEIERVQLALPIVKRLHLEACYQSFLTRNARAREANALFHKKLNQAERSYQRDYDWLVSEEIARAAKTYADDMASAAKTFNETHDALGREIAESDRALELTTEALQTRCLKLRQDIIGLTLDPMFQRLDMSFLRMRKNTGSDKGLPLFAVFTDSQPEFLLSLQWVKAPQTVHYCKETISVSNQSVADCYYNFRDALQKPLWEHIHKNLRGEWYYRTRALTVSVTAKFTGMIPAPVQKKIRKSRPFFEEILIVTEAPFWKPTVGNKSSCVPVPAGNTLAIGTNTGAFWLVDSFERSPEAD